MASRTGTTRCGTASADRTGISPSSTGAGIVTDAKQVIARQLTRSGEIFILAMEPLDDGEFFAENPDGLSAAWVTGHLACVADLFSSWFTGPPMTCGQEFHQVFNE